MPLTPEDVANKQFTSTRLKPGYDETEVDEFLDEVEAELARLYRENDELRAKLAQAARGGGIEMPDTSAMEQEIRDLRAKLADAQQRAAAPPAQAAPAPAPGPDTSALQRENEELRQRLTAMQRQLQEAQSRPAPQPAAAQGGAENATGILALAQRTADEHIAEARTQADRIIAEARNRADQLKREAEDRHRQTIGALETERAGLERKVEELRAFEREYRARLKNYLEGQLRELEGRSTEAPGGSGGPGGPGGPGGSGGATGSTPSAAGGQTGQGAPAGQPGQPGQQGQPRSPFAPGAPVAGQPPAGPPRQPGGYQPDDGSEQR